MTPDLEHAWDTRRSIGGALSLARLRSRVSLGCFGLLVAACGGSKPGEAGTGGTGASGGTPGNAGEAGEPNAGAGALGGGAGEGGIGASGAGEAGGAGGEAATAGAAGNHTQAGSGGLGGRGGGSGGAGTAGSGGVAGAGRAGSGGVAGGAGTAGSGGQMDPCSTNNGGCDPLVTCTRSGATSTCGACPRGYSGTGDGGCVAKTCDGAPDPDCACIKVTPDGDDGAALVSHGVKPFATVQTALDFAAEHPEVATKVCVAGGPACTTPATDGSNTSVPANATYTGPDAADLTMHDGVSLYGSYESTGFTRCSGPTTTTTLSLTTPAGVVFPDSATHTTVLDGFRVTHFEATTTTAISVRGAQGAALSWLDIEGGATAVDAYGVDVSGGARATLENVSVSLPLRSYGLGNTVPSGENYGVRAVGSEVTVDAGSMNLAVDGDAVYGVWLENAAGSAVRGTSIRLDAALGDMIGIHVEGAAASLSGNTVTLAQEGGGRTLGTELVDAPNVAYDGTVTAYGADNTALDALRSSVDANVNFTLRGGTGVLLDTSPGSTIQGSVTGQAHWSTLGVQVTGDATNSVLHDLTVDVQGEDGIAFSDCAGASPLVTTSSVRSTADAIASSGDCHPEITANISIVGVAFSSAPQAVNAVHCATACAVSDNPDIHLELQETSSQPPAAGTFTAAGIRCDAGCDVEVNQVSGLVFPNDYVQGRDITFRGSGIVTAGGLVARNRVSANCTGQGAGITASAGRLENNVVWGPWCGAGYLDNPALGAALEINGPVDVTSNTLFGSAAQYAESSMNPLNPCIEAGIRDHAGQGTFRNNIVSRSGGCTGADFFEVEKGLGAPFRPLAFQNNDLTGPSYEDDGSTLLTDIVSINALSANFSSNFSADPSFAPDGIHLSAGSACIDAGTSEGAPADDFDGDPRDAHPDVGADEWVGSGP